MVDPLKVLPAFYNHWPLLKQIKLSLYLSLRHNCRKTKGESGNWRKVYRKQFQKNEMKDKREVGGDVKWAQATLHG